MIKAIKNNAIVLFRSKFLLLILVLMSGFVVYGTYILYGKKVSPVQPLGNVMCLTMYLFLVMMFISCEYIQKFYNNGIYEILCVSDKKRKNIISAFAVLFIFSGILCTILSILVIKEFLFFKIFSPNNEYIKHIIVCMFLNCYLIMVLAIIIGGALAPIGNRILVYSILAAFGILSSPFAEKVAYTIVLGDTSGSGIGGRIIYKLISYFYIIPRFDMKLMPRSEYGESVLPYRYFI
jgi:ABC-type transport system involved in multi-copper enzyme maturation permease subunit